MRSVQRNRHPTAMSAPCACCSTPASNMCSRCRSVVYCSPACQRSHWPTHKTSCKVVAQAAAAASKIPAHAVPPPRVPPPKGARGSDPEMKPTAGADADFMSKLDAKTRKSLEVRLLCVAVCVLEQLGRGSQFQGVSHRVPCDSCDWCHTVTRSLPGTCSLPPYH